MNNAKLVAKQIADITRRQRIRALNELSPEFSEDDMRKAMVIPARGGDHANT